MIGAIFGTSLFAGETGTVEFLNSGKVYPEGLPLSEAVRVGKGRPLSVGSQESLDAYLASDLRKSIPEVYEIVGEPKIELGAVIHILR